MAVFDVETQKLVVRVVYDGAAFAGKTTNVKGLCAHFSGRRRSELFGADELDGRTLYFDWVQIEAGLAGGFPLSCQIVSVPGQAVLAARRRHLVSRADVVVLVCDGRRTHLAESREALRVLREVLAEQSSEAPLVVQANKQDEPDALGPSELLEALGLPSATPAVSARANEGVGVVETLVLAIRAAADRVQRADDADIDVRAAERPEDVLAELRSHEVSDEALLQLLSLGDEVDEVFEVRTEVREEAPLAASSAAPTREPAPVVAVAAPVPALPTFDVATGFLWPPLGRELLREIDPAQVLVRDDLIGRHGSADGSGKSDVFVLQAGSFCLKTSVRRRHPDPEQARAALLALARSKMRLGEWLLPKTVLAVQADDEGLWLWTVTPWVTTLGAAMHRAEVDGDETRLAEELESFAEAAVDSLALASRHGVALDVHPSNYARVGGRLRYLDDDVGSGSALPAMGHAILRRAEEFSAFPRAIDRFGDALLDHASRTLDEGERGALLVAVRDAITRASSAERLREILTGALAGSSGSDARRALG